MKRKEILEAAMCCVCGDREQDYGTPERNFELIADLWTTYLKAKCVSPEADVCINGEDVAKLSMGAERRMKYEVPELWF